MCYDWPVKNAIVNLPIRLEGNLKCISSNLFSSLGNWHCFAGVTKGVFTWHWGNFRPGVGSLLFPLMAVYLFTWYHRKMLCWRESPWCEFTLFLVLGREFTPVRYLATVSCKCKTTTRFGVKTVYRYSGTGSACVMFAILNHKCILSAWNIPLNNEIWNHPVIM